MLALTLALSASSCQRAVVSPRCPPRESVWVGSVATEGDERASAVAFAPDGAVYVAGYGFGFHPGHELFVRRLSADGEIEWTRSATGGVSEARPSIAVDGEGRVLVTGSYEGSMRVGGRALPEPRRRAIFLLRFDADGALDVARHFGGDDPARAEAVAVGNDGQIYLTGYFQGGLDLPGLRALSNPLVYDAFVAVFDAEIVPRWSAQLYAGGGTESVGLDVAVGPDGEASAVGRVSGGGRAGGLSIPARGPDTAVVVRFGPRGAIRWARAFDGARVWPHAIAVDEAGRTHVAGGFEGALTLGGARVTSVGREDGFVAALDRDGGVLWMRSLGGPAGDAATSIALGARGVFVAGRVAGNVELGSVHYAGSGDADAFLASYDFDGQRLWFRLFGSAGPDAAHALAAAPGRLAIAGEVSGPVGGAAYGGERDAFVLSMSDAPPAPAAEPEPEVEDDLPWPPPRRRWWDRSLRRAESPELFERARRACADGALATVRALVPARVGPDAGRGGRRSWPLLTTAVDNGRVDVVRYLLQRGADPDTGRPSVLRRALERGEMDIFRMLVESGVDTSDPGLLHAAIEHVRAVQYLLAGGADPDARGHWGRTPLIACAASRTPRVEVARALLDAGAAVDASPDHGYRALPSAAGAGSESLVRLLLEYQADVDASGPSGATALWAAAGSGHSRIVTILLNAGADVNVRSTYGNSALMEAARLGHADVVRLLLAHGAATDVRNRSGADARGLSIDREIIELLDPGP